MDRRIQSGARPARTGPQPEQVTHHGTVELLGRTSLCQSPQGHTRRTLRSYFCTRNLTQCVE